MAELGEAQEFEASLGNRVRPGLKTTNYQKQNRHNPKQI